MFLWDYFNYLIELENSDQVGVYKLIQMSAYIPAVLRENVFYNFR